MRLSLRDALTRVPSADGKRFSLLFSHGSLEVEIYAPRGKDLQAPHTRDEVYVVTQGSGTFLRGTQRFPFRTGDLLFVPAGEVHRFEDFTDDLAVWVLFYGPEGGEGANSKEPAERVDEGTRPRSPSRAKNN